MLMSENWHVIVVLTGISLMVVDVKGFSRALIPNEEN